MRRPAVRMMSDWKVLATVLTVFLASEFGLSYTEPRLSLDVQHIRQIPAIVRTFDSAQVPGVLYLGNSLTRTGIRPDIVARAWSRDDLPRVHSALIHPDDTRLLDWFYIYRRFVEPASSRPRIVVVCFARSHLADDQPLQPERLGSQFAGLPLLRAAFSDDVLSASDRIRYLLGLSSRVWANRERVQARALALIPGYETMTQTLNNAANPRARASERSQSDTYTRLARFIAQLRKDGASVIFVATPLPKHFPLPDELRRTIHDGGAELLDLQRTEPPDLRDFPDGYHMSPAAAERFSASLGAAMATSVHFRSALMGGAPSIYSASSAKRSDREAAIP